MYLNELYNNKSTIKNFAAAVTIQAYDYQNSKTATLNFQYKMVKLYLQIQIIYLQVVNTDIHLE